ncbi:hypothetical protein [Streptomyces sp. NBC_01443]|uniref:hypothetical protein n=1 Tax=Streptomyces sp. NBC_01443 TaxID=2903868 RepID=UPI002250CC83|nr:hypothetical protein [Streptomyces sp. NBC_01443]MCX4628327.1 hypothetical protein [Streptomyces sp. NBC_01443]
MGGAGGGGGGWKGIAFAVIAPSPIDPSEVEVEVEAEAGGEVGGEVGGGVGPGVVAAAGDAPGGAGGVVGGGGTAYAATAAGPPSSCSSRSFRVSPNAGSREISSGHYRHGDGRGRVTRLVAQLRQHRRTQRPAPQPVLHVHP